jgi:V/A-type H+-transporting ATPase subunit I
MLNIVGHMDDLDRLCKNVVLHGFMQPVSALQEINTTDFTLKATEENKQALLDVCYIRPYINTKDYTLLRSKVDKLKKMCEVSSLRKPSIKDFVSNYDELEIIIDNTIYEFENIYDELLIKRNEIEDLKNTLEHLKFVQQINVSLDKVEKMFYFHFSLLKVTNENIIRLKHNYENIPAILISVYKHQDYEMLMSFTPYILKPEADRIFKSLNCETIFLPNIYEGTPEQIVLLIKSKIDKLSLEISELNTRLKELSEKRKDLVAVIIQSVELEIKSGEIKVNTAYTNDFFYLCGWIPKSKLKEFKLLSSTFEDRLIIIEKTSEEIESSLIPPTKLKNNFIVKPFEAMVKMYGIPSYGELDPTSFLGISYMLIFGAMFGDLGQGMVFFLAGLYLKYFKRRENFGGVLARLGISSSIFGLAYGSVFGFEEFIQPLFIRPMEDITQILVYAVIFGCVLLIIGFGYSLINNLKKKDVENGFFGRDGVTGLFFYLSVIVFAVTKYKQIHVMPTIIWIFIFIILLVLMLLKEPLANLIMHRRPLYSESKGDYFIEEGFGVIETLLSMFSNTLSFIRVGAFALNHVGLFLAFTALANMMKNSFESVLMYILGNIVIIGLEGLIVFIQGLRLEYYELFSKYYEGAGIPFEPIKLSEDFTNSRKHFSKMFSYIKIKEE